MKRGLKGTFVSVEPFHLFRYLNEQVYRFNSRRLIDMERIDMVPRQIVGKRLTYEKLSGQEPETEKRAN
jgi:hypothetical protein